MNVGVIGDFFSVKGGKRLPKGAEFEEQETSYPYLRVADFERNSFNSKNIRFISAELSKVISNYTICSDDVYISIAGTIGVAGIIPKNLNGANLTENAAKISPKNGVEVYPKFLSYYLNSSDIQQIIKSKTMAVGVPKLALFRIQEIPVTLPPLATQKKIAAILDAADAHRQKTKQLLAKYDELAQSIFLEMFGDNDSENISLSDLIEINPKKSEISSLDKETEVSFVPMADVSEEGDMKINQTRRISEVWSGFTYFREDDVVFAKITPCMENGKGAIARTLVNGIGFGTTEFHVLRPKKGVSTSSWIFQLTHSKFFRKQAESNMTGSAGQKRVPKDFFFKFKIPRPAY